MRTQGQVGRLHAKERGLRRSQPHQHPDGGRPAPRTVGKRRTSPVQPPAGHGSPGRATPAPLVSLLFSPTLPTSRVKTVSEGLQELGVCSEQLPSRRTVPCTFCQAAAVPGPAAPMERPRLGREPGLPAVWQTGEGRAGLRTGVWGTCWDEGLPSSAVTAHGGLTPGLSLPPCPAHTL